MKPHTIYIFILLISITLPSIACRTLTEPWIDNLAVSNNSTPTISPTKTPLPPKPVEPGEANPNELTLITGEISYTSPFFLNMISEPFVLLEDQAGFIARDEKFEFTLDSQAIGPVEILSDNRLSYNLALPSVPQGTQVDVDNDEEEDFGVQVFAVAFWSNTWGGPFLEPRDGTGWSNAYTSTLTDPERDNEIVGGILIVWSPNDDQEFPTGFGDDGFLFTPDDPVSSIPAGYNIVNLNETPFVVYKEANPIINLLEGVIALNDYSDLSYEEAFGKLYEKMSKEYPFTKEKEIDWEAIYTDFAPKVTKIRNDQDYYRLLREFTWRIPDGHVGIQLDSQAFYEDQGGGFGLVLTKLSDERVIVSQVIPGSPADKAGISQGAEITKWNNLPVLQAISEVNPYFGPYSTEHLRKMEQVIFLTRVPPGDSATIEYINPGSAKLVKSTVKSNIEYESLFAAVPSFREDVLAPPVEGEVLDGTDLGYIRINTFSGDYALTASLWEHYISSLLDNEIEGLIIDVRTNLGGSGSMANDFAGYFFDHSIELYWSRYYNEYINDFKLSEHPTSVEPAPLFFNGPVAVLISPYCTSACEGFAFAMSQEDRAILIGQAATSGAFGEVSLGQYKLPGDFSLQFPTGRPVDAQGNVVIEGTGVIPDILIPITIESALGSIDPVLEAAIQALVDNQP